MPRPEIETLTSREVYRNRWLAVREDEIRRADGGRGVYGVVSKPDFAAIVPWESEGITLVQQYRYPVGLRRWELPQGNWPEGDADPEELARGELAEETGLRAAHVEKLGYLHLAYGFCDQGYHAFLATGLTRGERDLDPEEVGLVARRFPLAEMRLMIVEGEITDATTVAVLGLLALKHPEFAL